MIITKNFFKNKNNLKIIVAVFLTFLACWFADRHNDWNLDMMVKEISTVFIVLVSVGILPYSMYKSHKKKDQKDDEKKE